YFPGYGVVFNVNETYASNYVVSGSLTPVEVTGYGTRYNQRTAQTVQEMEDARIAEEAKKVAALDSAQSAVLDRHKALIRDFFSNYVDAIGQLTPDDRISVLISQRGNAFTYVTVGQGSKLQTNT